MERYNEYKDSGIYFIPDIPKSWQVLKAKYLFKQEKREVRPEDEIVTCFRDGQVTLRKNRRTEGFTNSMKEIGYQGVRKGDLVIHNMDAFAGAIGVSDSDGKGTPVYACCTPKRDDVNQYYYCYLLRHLARNGFILSLAKGIRERSTDFRFNDFKELSLPVPSREEQDAIVSYIDLHTTKIDAAIAQQQKMIDLLNERKQIIINNAVTKGLNPNVKMKDSGVDWIGEIPEHWEVTKLKSIGTTINGVSHDSSYFGEGYPFVSYSDVYKNSILPLKVNGLAKSSTLEQKIFSVEEGDVFFTRTSETAEEIGITSTCVKTIPQAVFAGFLIRFRPRKGILDSKFSSFYFRAQIHRSYFVKEMNLVIRASLSQQLLKGLPVLLPHIQEQREIADYLNAEIGKIEQAINTYTKQISLLQERKQIIINEVVTGKVKVTK